MKKIFTFAIMAVVLIAWNGGMGAYAAPAISFVEPPTPVDGASIEDTSVEIEVSITELNLKDVIFNWDGTDYSLYDDSLVLMFNFDNVGDLGEDYVNGSPVIDVSGSGNNGILSVTPGIPQWVAGRYGGAFDFTGDGGTSGQSILVPHDDSLNPGSGDFAIAVWILTRDDYDGDILRKGSTDTASTWYKLEHSPSVNNNKIGLNFNTDGTDALFASVAAYNDYQWHFVVAQRKGNQAELWIDGVLDGAAPVTGSISNTANLAVGSKDTQDDDFLNSTLDEVRIYMRSFSQNEIKELYYSNLSKYAADSWTLYVNQSNLSDEITYTYQASASDTVETSSTEQRSLTVDLIGPPGVTLEAPSDWSILNHTNVTFTSSATDDIGLLDVSLYVGSTPETVTFSGPADTDDAQLYATDDTSTPEVEGPDTNAGTAAIINVDGANPHAHAVIKFLNVFGDGAGQVPLDSTIVSATLGVNCTNSGNMIELYRLIENWAEGEVTWNNSSDGTLWPNGGADGTVSNAGFALDGDCTTTGWRTMDITQFVQEWSDGANNFGIVLTDSGATDGIDFDTSESANPPVLTVIFGQSGLQLIETVTMSGTSDSVSFSTVNLGDQQDYTWNCLVRNTSLLESWAPADFQLTVDTAYPDEPILVQPADESTVVGLSPTLEVTVSDPQGEAMDVTFYGHRAGSADEFTIVALPDTQKYVVNGAYPEIFTAQTQWIVDNKDALNIVLVTHEGDIVDNWNSTTEWDYVNTSMSKLDGVVPYGVVPGDHDHEGQNPDGSTQYYESYFPASRFSSNPWWGADYNNNTNNYQLMTIGGQDYIFLGLDFCPSQDELDWANGILTTYSDRKAILTTHTLIDTNAQYYGSSDFSRYPNGDPNPTGDTSLIWYDLIRHHENLQLVLCGNMHGEARRTDDNLAGNPVHQLLANYQSRPNGGNGWLRIMRFVPAEDKVYVETYSPYLDQYETDADSQFTLNLPMNYFEEIGTVTGVASGLNASVVWAGLLDATEYEWFVEVTDAAQHTQVGPTWSFTA
ncbi:MAG TPA: DNRLRE domain-containing protein, partial [Sedimentisphaerales bacterium]|nr:DNRLRE domain-containing protein [Sedimentisphaerales bacterium]